MNQKRHKCIRSVITVVLFNERYLILHNQHEDLRRTRSGPCVLCVTSLGSSLGYSIDTVPCEVHSISAWVQFLKKKKKKLLLKKKTNVEFSKQTGC